MYGEFSLELFDSRRRALSVEEEIDIIHGYPAKFPQPRSFIIHIAGFAPRPDFGIDDLIDLVSDRCGEKFFIARFCESSSDGREEFGFLGFRQTEIVG